MKRQQEKEKHKQDTCEAESDDDRSAIGKHRQRLKKTIDEAQIEEHREDEGPSFEVEVDGRSKEDLNHKIKKEESRDCSEQETKLYRSVVMKLNYLAMDRPDLQWAVRRCAKNMSSPTT